MKLIEAEKTTLHILGLNKGSTLCGETVGAGCAYTGVTFFSRYPNPHGYKYCNECTGDPRLSLMLLESTDL